MKNRNNKLKSIFAWALGNIVWQLLILFLTNLTYVVVFIKFVKTFSILEIVLITILLLIVIVLVSYNIWKKFSYKSYYYPRKAIKPEFHILHKDVYYEIDEKNNTTYCKQIIKFKVCCDSLKRIESSFLWTGSDTPNLPQKCENDEWISEIIAPTVSQEMQEKYPGVWIPYYINFFSPIKKGTTKTISYEWRFSSLPKKSFLSMSTYEPTKKLTFELIGNTDYFSNDSFRVSEKRSPIMDYHIKNFYKKDNKKDENGVDILQDLPKNNDTNLKLLSENGKKHIKVTLESVKRFRTYVFDWSSHLD